jgi:hypothetical protein
LNNGDEYEIVTPSDDTYWFRFVPETSGMYSFKSVSGGNWTDPDCFLYNANGEWITDSFDVNDMDFDLIYYFEAGETYYFDVYDNYGEATYKVVLNRIIHSADDGSEHTDIEIVEGTDSNCTEHGYTDGLYCNECEKYVYGHEELPLDEEYHIDDDENDVCDLCGKEDFGAEECEHMCHSDNWFMKIIWNIANLFNRIFRLSPECECGVAHY